MKVTFKSSTNEIFNFLKDVECELTIDLILYFKFTPFEGTPFDFRHGTARSSYITSYTSKEISMNCYELTFQTYNSIHVFQYGKYDKNKPALTKDEKQEIAFNMMF